MSTPGARRTIDLLGYHIHVAPWLLDDAGRHVVEAAGAHTFAVVTDANVGPIAAPRVVASIRHYAPHARVILRAMPAGEQEKTRDAWGTLTDWLLEERCGRDTTVVALGGGVIGDLAGFVAATFMRGVPVIQVPTSLLAMVDASVGGKVAVDTKHGKNLVGAFHQPALVLADPTVLQTLPVEHLRAGLAEMLKHGVIANATYFQEAVDLGKALLESDATAIAWHGDPLTALIAGSVRIKADIVARDERERGLRRVLNFGHTVGHALELCSNFSLLHGEAVAIGMCIESRLAVLAGVASPSLPDLIRAAVEAVGLPFQVPSAPPRDLLEAMRSDKKVQAGSLTFALPAAIGLMAGESGGISVPDALVMRALQQE